MAADPPRRTLRRGLASRLWSTSKVATTAARLAMRGAVGITGSGDRKLGEGLARELDRMKGMAMKVGQILSYFDGVLPEDTHAALRALQAGTDPLAFETIVEVIEAAFGRPLDDLYEYLDPEAVAAASIGQVHRGRFEGRDVAVKVQYPGIRDTIAQDFSRIAGFAKFASVATAVDGPALVAEVRARFVEECDYREEARNQASFAAAFSADPDVEIPDVLPERCAETVLTTAWAEGVDMYAFASVASQARRNEVATILMRFAYRSLFGLGAINADPHPGNYRLRERGPVVFLDFGCVRHFDRAFVDAERRLARVVVSGDRAAFGEALRATGMVGVEKGFDDDVHWELMRHQYRPYIAPAFQFTPEYVREGLQMSRPGNPNLRKLAIPPPWIWWQRLQWGLHAVLARLGAHGDFDTVLRDALDAPWTPLRATEARSG